MGKSQALTDENPQVCADHVKHRDMSNICHHAADASENRCQSNYGVKRCYSLWQSSWRNSSSYQCSCTYDFGQIMSWKPENSFRYLPRILPMPARLANCISTSGEKPTAARDASIPEPTPKIPRKLPRRAVNWEARPESEPRL